MPTAQASPTNTDNELALLNLQNVHEKKVYRQLKDQVFTHTPEFDTDFLTAIGMDVEFNQIFHVMGWENISPVWERGSRLLTLEFLCTMQILIGGCTFRFFGTTYVVNWKQLSTYLGFDSKCSTDVNSSSYQFHRPSFWELVTRIAWAPNSKPKNSDIHHPTLKFLHRWIAVTLFPRADSRTVREDEMRILFAVIHKTKVAPVMEIMSQWLEYNRSTSAISCCSLITRIASALNALEGKNVDYITSPHLVLNEDYFKQGHQLKKDKAGRYIYYFAGFTNEYRLPNPKLHLYNSELLTFDLVLQEEMRL